MTAVSPEYALLLAWVLFLLGLVGVIMRRNAMIILMSLEIMLNAAGLAFVAAGFKRGTADGQVMYIFILAMAAAEVSVGLGLLLQIYRHFRTLDADAASTLKD